jgi:hypothetical protein
MTKRATTHKAIVPEARTKKYLTSKVKATVQEKPNIGKDFQDKPMLGFLHL